MARVARRLGGALLAAGLLACDFARGPVEIRLDTDPASPTFHCLEVTGLDGSTLRRLRAEGGSPEPRVFAVYTEPSPMGADQPPVLGTTRIVGERLIFTPRFEWVPGQAYRVEWRPPQAPEAEPRAVLRFSIDPPLGAPPASVVAIHPSADEVPENLLKLYVRFSSPMSRDEAERRIRLFASSGVEVEAPFVAPERELWSPDRDRLTIFFDPGRIKRQVGPNLELGPPLRQGETYRLVISRQWRDAWGQKLAADFEKTFTVVAPDRAAPRTEEWTVLAPATPDAPLELVFPEPLDHALLERLLRVTRGGEPVDGEVEIADGERRWTFRPALPWALGVYEARVGTALEDLAGNSLRRPFETAVGDQPDAVGPSEVALPFEVGAAQAAGANRRRSE